MQRNRLSVVAVAAVAILFAVPGAAVADPKETCESSKQTIDAMVEQFGLTQQQARERIAAECRATGIRDAAREAAADAYGGAWFDPGSKNLVVGITDPARFDAVSQTGAAPKLVSTAYTELEQDLHVLDERTGTAPPEVTNWRIDEAANVVAVDVAGGPSQGVTTFVAGLKHARVDYDQPPVQTTADLIGGMAITSSAGRCSLGFNARNAAGVVYVLTAGHCTNIASTWSGSAGTIGTVAGSSFPANDYGRIQRTNAIWLPTSKIQGGASVLGSTVAPVGTTVCRSGSTTGYRCGFITATNQTVCYAQGCVYQLTRTNACAEPGDSGGSFVSSTRQAQGVVSGGSGNCSFGGTTFFQPLNEILAVYGLTLFTG